MSAPEAGPRKRIAVSGSSPARNREPAQQEHLKLANVEWPVVSGRSLVHERCRLLGALDVPLVEEEVDQGRDVLAPVPQRWELYEDPVEAPEQVGAQRTPLDVNEQGTLGGDDGGQSGASMEMSSAAILATSWPCKGSGKSSISSRISVKSAPAARDNASWSSSCDTPAQRTMMSSPHLPVQA